MAEVVGFVASFAAILQLVEYGKKFAKELRRFYNCSSFLSDEAQRGANQVRNFSNAIGIAQIALQRHCQEHSDSPVLRYIGSNQVFEGLEAESDCIQRRLFESTKQLKRLRRGKSTIVTFLKWHLRKESIFIPVPDMDLIQSSMSLMMHAAALETLGSQNTMVSTKSHAQTKSLEKQLDVYRDTIRALMWRIDSLESQRQPQNLPRQAYSKAQTGFPHEALMTLGTSMIEMGNIPQSRPFSSYPPSSTSSWNSLEDFETDLSDEVTESSFSSNMKVVTTTDVQPSAPLPSRVPLPPNYPAPPENIHYDSHGQSDSEEESSTSRIIMLNLTDNTNSTSGYVKSSTGTVKHVTAIVLGTFDGNIISMGKAGELGINVIPEDDAEKVWIGFGDGTPQATIGKAELLWTGREAGMANRPPIPLRCYVVEHLQPPLILGKPFLEGSQRLWRRPRGR